MITRGVTRPMVLDQLAEDEATTDADGPSLLERHHRATLWIPWTLVLLGAWLVLAPFTFGYLNRALWAVPSGGRGAWFADEVTTLSLRAHLMAWSDVISGLLLVVLGWRALRPDRPISRWLACGVGIWLVFAPVVLWSPTAAGFANDSLIGLLVIALTILIPGMPNMAAFMEMGPARPPGWSYNPSTWSQRSVLIALGFAGMVISRYLAAYQLGYISSVWDPFFGFAGGTQPVLDSQMSHLWPISDAALGGVAYTFEFLMGFMGASSRWRTMPWMVAMFGILVIPLGLSHIALVMSQPVVVHHWSTLALAAAAVMLPMITLTVDEVVAMGQHLRAARRRGDRDGSTWKVFWLGGSAEDCQPDEDRTTIAQVPDHPLAVARAGVRGATAPLGLVLMAILGVALLAAPGLFDVSTRSGAADVGHLAGAATIVVAVVAMAEPVRLLRWLAVPIAGVAIATLALTAPPTGYAVAVVLASAGVAASATWRGPVLDRYGAWTAMTR
ncbi:MAG: vitamin K epoxide reductase family protein [Acidimicrobiales bacterium]|nr:vitamin K epoxide reductase family protein [Acidimicrobiales bacterium]